MLSVDKIRKDFPILQKKMMGKPLIYFDSAATTQKPKKVIDALSSFYLEEYGTVHRAIYELSVVATEKYNASRKAVKEFLHAESEECIIFTRGTTDGINLVARSLSEYLLQPGDEILISESEHHSNIVPWQMACERVGCKLKVLPINDHAEISIEQVEKMISEKTKIVSIGHIANSTGTLHPVKELIEKAHKKGALVLIDGAQSAGHLLFDVQALDADFYVFSGHKIYGPNGIGILYGKKHLLEKMPPLQGGGDMIEKVTFEKTTYQKLPLKFEAGTPSIAEAIVLKDAIDYIETLGRKNIEQWEQKLLLYATGKMEKIPYLKIIGTAKQKGAIISFVVDGVHPLDLGTFLNLEGIAVRTGHHCAQPTMRRFGIEATTRISFGIYNTFEEIDIFVQTIEILIKKLRG